MNVFRTQHFTDSPVPPRGRGHRFGVAQALQNHIAWLEVPRSHCEPSAAGLDYHVNRVSFYESDQRCSCLGCHWPKRLQCCSQLSTLLARYLF